MASPLNLGPQCDLNYEILCTLSPCPRDSTVPAADARIKEIANDFSLKPCHVRERLLNLKEQGYPLQWVGWDTKNRGVHFSCRGLSNEWAFLKKELQEYWANAHGDDQ